MKISKINCANAQSSPTFKGTVDSSVYKYARVLKDELIERTIKKSSLSKQDMALRIEHIMQEFDNMLKRLEKKAASLHKDTIIGITETKLEFPTKQGSKTGYFLTARNPLVKSAPVGCFFESHMIKDDLNPDNARINAKRFKNIIGQFVNFSNQDETLARAARQKILERVYNEFKISSIIKTNGILVNTFKSDGSTVMNQIKIKQDVANLLKFQKECGINKPIWQYIRGIVTGKKQDDFSPIIKLKAGFFDLQD